MELKFKAAYEQYLIYIESRQKEQSKKTLKERFKNRILPYWSDYNIFDIKEFDYVKWQNEIEKNNFCNNYKNGLHYLMTSFFDYLIIFYDLKYNIPRRVGPFKSNYEKTEHNFYTLLEFNRFIKNIDNNIYKQFFNLMFFTGTRPGEAMALKFSDLHNNLLSINKTISEHCINGTRHTGSPKSFSSVRDIFIDKKLYKDLLKLKKYYIDKYMDSNYDYFIFGGLKPLAPTTINRYKIKACIKSNLKPIKLHEFRHSHASLLYNSNIDMQSIKERLGHSNINTTMGVYVHLTKKKEKRVSRTLNFLRYII